MSLQIWMPLSGSINNQGLLNPPISSFNAPSFQLDGKIGKCFVADNGSKNSNGIKVSTNLVTELGDEYSVSVWIKQTGDHANYEGAIISSGDWNKSHWSFGISQDNTKIDVFSSGHQVYVKTPSTIPANQWTHIASTQKDGLAKVYVNGGFIGQRSCESLNSDVDYFTIGRETYANGWFGFNGKINDLRIYNHCLSPKEIKLISQALVLHYPLGNIDGYIGGRNIEKGNMTPTPWTPAPEDVPHVYDNVIYDCSGNCNNSEIIGANPLWEVESPRYSGCIDLHGSTYLKTNAPVFYDDINQCHTVCAWVNLKDGNGNQTLTNLNKGYFLSFSSSLKTLMYLNDLNNDSYVYGDVLPLNQWVHIAWVLDTNCQRCEVYYNGEFHAKSANYIFTDIPFGVNKNLIMFQGVNGMISDVRIYGTALSQKDIKDIYETSASVTSFGSVLLSGEVVE